MNEKLKVVNSIIPNVETEIPLLVNHLKKLILYEKEKGKWYIKSHDAYGKEKLVFDENKNQKRPEEIVRQLFLFELTDNYSYPKDKIKVEEKVNFGREKKRADIVVYQQDGITPWILVEVKAPHEKLNIPQLKSYLNAEGSPIGVAVNGKEITILYRPYPKEFDDNLPDIPAYGEYLEVKDKENPAIEVADIVLNRKWTLEELEKKSKEKAGELRGIIETLEELVLANSGVDVFNEIFKLIYSKLYDEWEAKRRKNKELKFRKYKDPQTTYKVISELFDRAKNKWRGIFESTEKIKLTPEHLNVCVGELMNIKLFFADLRIIDEAFEYLITKVAKGEKGQFFTPRVIIDAAVRMLSPHSNEYVVDPACGSAGFLIHAMQYVFNKYNIDGERDKIDYAYTHLWGIDFDERTVKISKALMLIAGDGKSHIYKENSLEFTRWSEKLKADLREDDLVRDDKFKELNFDILMTNPPFAGEIKERQILSLYYQILTTEVLRINIGDKLREKIVDKILSDKEKNMIEKIVNDLKLIRKKYKTLDGIKENYQDSRCDLEEITTIQKDDTVKIDYKKLRLLKIEIEGFEEKKQMIDEIYNKLKSLNKEINDFSVEGHTDEVMGLLRDEYGIELDEETVFIKKTKEPSDYDKVDRHILFIERTLNMIKPGGRLAIVLPQGVFNNTNDRYIRKFIMKKARILAVIGLHGNSFKPHTGTKTSLLVLRKWKEEELDEGGNPKIKDYPIFFAVSKVSFKDNSGNYIFVKDKNGNLRFDEKGNPIYQTDLFDLADAFIKWGKKRLEGGDGAFDFLNEGVK